MNSFKDYYLMPVSDERYTLTSFNWSFRYRVPGSGYFYADSIIDPRDWDLHICLNDIDNDFVRIFRVYNRSW